jgi:hypothetical protein
MDAASKAIDDPDVTVAFWPPLIMSRNLLFTPPALISTLTGRSDLLRPTWPAKRAASS